MLIPRSFTAQTLRTAAAAAVALVLAAAAEAGPPLICHQFDAGKAALLPWASTGQGWNTPDRSYDIKNLTADTLRLLSPDAPILARMENMRRAAIYAGQDERIAAELLTAVLARAQADAGRGASPLAWFDAGYLVETYRQATHIYKWDMLNAGEKAAWQLRREPVDVDGYAMVKKALRLAPSPEMEFAASLMKEGPASADHRRRAAAGAQAGSLLARNLATH
ncbi:MAG TPA: hypothetical protein VFJ02_17225 [Vicinamibacterales bacterium]|nr:hypothetical protein [Vicinamibacterales bacterium]